MKIQPVFTETIKDNQGNQAGELRVEYHDDGSMLMYTFNTYSNLKDLNKEELKKLNDNFMEDVKKQLENSVFSFLLGNKEPIIQTKPNEIMKSLK